jgi:hypothetical protein
MGQPVSVRLNLEQLSGGDRGQTDLTLQFVTEMRIPPLRCCYPMPIRPRRIVPDILLMPACKISNPVETLVQMIVHDLTRRTRLQLRVQYVPCTHSTLFMPGVPKCFCFARVPSSSASFRQDSKRLLDLMNEEQ